YNQAVKEYNSIVKTFPTFLFARLFGFDMEKPYFKAITGAEKPPEVKF
ncbi:LemA family protein, partial [candidate division WOR-3 bacterium]|nr:LemA family protein [candidate division WOR-3 bacterium]